MPVFAKPVVDRVGTTPPVPAEPTPKGAEEAHYPPAYHYVDNPRYGHWQRRSDGSQFWEFYGKYAMFSHLMGAVGGVGYDDWGHYRRHRSQSSRKPYFGRDRQYGTNGSYTKKAKPTFFQRQATRERSRKQSFSNKVANRTRRSGMSGARSRSGGRGGK